jgi:hypothetical protein
LTIDEDSTTGPLPFAVNDDRTPPAGLIVNSESSNPGLVPAENIVLGGTGTDRTLSVTPASNQSGSAVLTITVSDGSLAASQTFVLTVNPVNDAPTVSDLSDIAIAEDGSSGPVSLTVGDIETDAASLTLSAVSSNPVLIPVENIFFGGTGASRTVTLIPIADQFGVATITVTVSDGESTASDTFVLTVNAVNDIPTLSNIADSVVDEDTSTGVIGFTVGDVDTPAANLTVSASSSNPALVPVGNIVFGGSAENRTIAVTPATNQYGAATITVTVDDGSLNASDTFLVTVSPVNDTPIISGLADRSINEDGTTGTIPFTIGDAETPADSLVVSAISSNPALVPAGNIVLGDSGANRTIAIAPATNQSGSATITVVVDDGELRASDTFVLTVDALNDAPVISDLADRVVNEDNSLGPIEFTVDDLETPATGLIVTANSSNPVLVPADHIVLGGSGASRTLILIPATNQAGTATITVVVSDGALTASDTFLLTVNAVNDVPTLSDIPDLSINEDTATSAILFTIGDVETPAGSLVVSATSSNPALVPAGNIVLGGTGANRTITLSPATNQSGAATITVTVSDGTSSSSDTFLLNVNAVNDVPTISDIANQTTSQGTPTTAIPFTIGDVETPASLTLGRASSNQTLVPTNNIVFGGSGSNRTVTVTPASGQSGTATITVSVSDGAASASDTFVLTVTSNGNTAPTISDIADRSISEDSNTGNISFTIGDTQTAAGSLILSKGSSNPALVPTNNIVFGGSSANRTVRVTPQANQFGAVVITVTVSDGSLSTSDTFVVTVNPVNDAPTISDTTNRTTLEDTGTGPIAFTVNDVDSTADSLTLTAASSNPTRVPVGNIVFGGSGTNRTVTVTPGTNQTGSATVTITVSDGALTASDSFSLTISAVNDPPTLSDIANRTVARGTSTGAIGFTIGDVETTANSLTLSKASSNLTLVPTNNIVFGGSGANRTVTVTPAAGQSGTATITVSVSDGSVSTSDTFVLTVQ